jgi:hypothetical protein
MNLPRVQPEDYIDFLIATPKAASGVEAARVQPDKPRRPAHDAFTRLLHRLEPDPATLWAEAGSQVDKADGILVIDDSTFDRALLHVDRPGQPPLVRQASCRRPGDQLGIAAVDRRGPPHHLRLPHLPQGFR